MSLFFFCISHSLIKINKMKLVRLIYVSYLLFILSFCWVTIHIWSIFDPNSSKQCIFQPGNCRMFVIECYLRACGHFQDPSLCRQTCRLIYIRVLLTNSISLLSSITQRNKRESSLIELMVVGFCWKYFKHADLALRRIFGVYG